MTAYLDSCVLIYLIEGDDALRMRINELLAEAPGGPVRPVVSDLTRMECRVRPLRDDNEELLGQYDSFFALADVDVVPLTAEVIDQAAELRARTGLKTPDALHMAVALVSECKAFWTNDLRLANAAADMLEIRVITQLPGTSYDGG